MIFSIKKIFYKIRLSFRRLRLHNAPFRKLFGRDHRKRGFFRKYIFRLKTLTFAVILYVLIFLKRNFLGIIPLLSGDALRIENIHSNFTDNIYIQGLHIRKIDETKKIDIFFEKVSLDVGRQEEGEKLLAVNRVYVENGYVNVDKKGTGDSEDGGVAFRSLIKNFALVRNILLTKNVEIILKNIDFSFSFKSVHKEFSFKLEKLTGKGNVLADKSKFCPTLSKTDFFYHKEKFNLTAKGCIYPEHLKFDIPVLFSHSHKNERVTGSIMVEPFLKNVKGELKLTGKNIQLNRFFPKKRIIGLSSFSLGYRFHDDIEEKVELTGNIKKKKFRISLLVKNKNHSKWQIETQGVKILNNLFTLSNAGLKLPELNYLVKIKAKGENIHSRGNQGNIKLALSFNFDKTSKRNIRKKNDTLFSINSTYRGSRIRFEKIHLASPFGLAVGKGTVNPKDGWNIYLKIKNNNKEKLKFSKSTNLFFLNFSGLISLKGKLGSPVLRGRFKSKNLSYILKDNKPYTSGNEYSSNSEKEYARDTNIFYYHTLEGRFKIRWKNFRFHSISGDMKGFESLLDEKKSKPFRALFSYDNHTTGMGVILIQNFAFLGYSYSANIQLWKNRTLLLRLSNISILKNNNLLVTDADIIVKKRLNNWTFSTRFMGTKKFHFHGKGSIALLPNEKPRFTLEFQGKIIDLSVLSQFGLKTDRIKGNVDLKISASGSKQNNFFLLDLATSKLFFENKDSKLSEIFQLSTKIKYDNNALTQKLLLNTSEGYLRCAVKGNFYPKKDDPYFTFKPDEPLTFSLLSKNFYLDNFNPIMKAIGINHTFSKALLESTLSGKGNFYNMKYKGSLSVEAQKWRSAFNTFTNIKVSVKSINNIFGIDSELITPYRQGIGYWSLYQNIWKENRGKIIATGVVNLANLIDPKFRINLKAQNTRFYLSRKNFLTVDSGAIFSLEKGLFVLKAVVNAYNGKFYVDDFAYIKNNKKNISSLDQQQSTDAINKILKNWNIDLQIILSENLWVKSSLVNIELKGQGNFIKDTKEAKVKGYLKVQRGNLYVQNNDFEIEFGKLDFTGTDMQKYHLELLAKTEISGKVFNQDIETQIYDIYFSINGELKKPIVTFFSDPPLARNRILTALLSGQVIPYGSGGRYLAMSTSAAALNLYTNQINRFVEKQTGMDMFKLQVKDDSEVSKQQMDALLSAGKYLTKKLYLKAEAEVNQIDQYSLTMEYNLTKWLKLSGSRKKEEGKEIYDALIFINFNY